MNYWILGAGILGALTSLVHILAGQIDPVRPFLKSDLAEIPKATLLACWHMVSAILVISAGSFIYVGLTNIETLNIAVTTISLTFVVFAAVFICVGWHFFGFRTLVKLPQWVLLLPIGVLGYVGAM